MPFIKLVKGFRRFQKQYFKDDNNTYQKLIEQGQSPEALVIACSDSRNDPALLMNSEPGDLFVVRNVAAIVPPYGPDGNYHGTSAAIEFAVKGLKVKNIVVLGHALCGGVRELATGENAAMNFEFLKSWIEIGAPARDAIKRELADAPLELRLRALEQAVIVTSINNLMTFPWIQEKVASGEIRLHGWYFDMVNGQMMGYDFEKGSFLEATQKLASLRGSRPDDCCGNFSLDPLIRSYG
jgi:carbonic anhydrase